MMMNAELLNPAYWLQNRARLQPDVDCIVFWLDEETSEHWTYQALLNASIALASEMLSRGLKAGDRVAYMDFNDVRYAITMFAMARIGAIFVPINFRLSPAEVLSQVRDCEPSVFIYGGDFLAIRDSLAAECSNIFLIESNRHQADLFGEFVNNTSVVELPIYKSPADYPAWLMYTSGSTGHPKAVIHTYSNLFWNTINMVLLQGGFASDRVLISAPLFHVAPASTFMDAFLRGACTHLERSFDAVKILNRVQQQKITLVAGVPAMYKMMAAAPNFSSVDLSSLRAILVGGAPVPEALIAMYHERDVAVIHRYGLTEVTSLATALSPTAPASKQMTAGLPPLFSELRITNSDGSIVGTGEIGQIEIKGPHVTPGYWNNEQETSAVIQNGWFRTGDLGRCDAEHYLSVAGRIKDMIISGGENIYSAEVEARLVENPSILEAAVIGVPDPKWGEVVCAVLSIKPNHSTSMPEILEGLNGRLARYKQPRLIYFKDSLPKNGAGKVDKLALRREFSSQ